MNKLPSTGFIRLAQIIGDKSAEPPIEPIIPASKSTWWAGVKAGRYSQSVRLGGRCTAWRADIRAYIESVGGEK